MNSSDQALVPSPRAEFFVTPQDLLDALPDATAVLDATGTVVLVNRAWRDFASDNGGDPRATGPGVSYVQVCERAAMSGCSEAAEVATGILAVLEGGSVEAVMHYPCPSPTVKRWFNLRVTALPSGQQGVVVSHVNITRHKLAELDLERRASHDALTGLANRTLFTTRLETALSQQRRLHEEVGVVFLDLDDFKPVNDTFGHHSGDEVLQAVAARLCLVVREHDTVARLGGDEFAILVPDATAEGLATLASRIESSLAEPHQLHGRQVRVSASLGSSLATRSSTANELVREADAAMYLNKQLRQPLD